MGGLLGYHRFDGFLGDRDTLRTEHGASDVVQLAFLGRWWLIYQTNRQPARELVSLAVEVGMDLGDASDSLAARRLAWRLHDLVGSTAAALSRQRRARAVAGRAAPRRVVNRVKRSRRAPHRPYPAPAAQNGADRLTLLPGFATLRRPGVRLLPAFLGATSVSAWKPRPVSNRISTGA
jgi:hypothetical protein